MFKQKIAFLFILLFVLSSSVMTAYAGVGGVNEYKGRSYVWKDLGKLEELLLSEGYIELTPENNYKGLLDDNSYKRYTSVLSEGVRLFVNEADLEAYMADPSSANRRTLWENQVEFFTYGYKPVEKAPASYGTLTINPYAAPAVDYDVTLVLSNLDTEDVVFANLQKLGDYKYTDNIPVGHYRLASVCKNGNIYDPVTAYYETGLTTSGFQIYEGAATVISIGIEMPLPTDALTLANIDTRDTVPPTPTPISATPFPNNPEQESPAPADTRNNAWILILLPIVICAIVAGIIYWLYKRIKEKHEQQF